MLKGLHIQSDWATVLSFVFGAAVIVPSVVALVLAIAAVARNLL